MVSGRPNLAAGLDLRQEQRAQPRLYQAMDLLHMPLLDLQGHLRQALVDNPFLDLVEPGDEPDDTVDDLHDVQAEDARDDPAEEVEEVDWENVLLDDFDPGGRREEYGDREYYAPTAAATRSLWDHLHEQLNLLRLGERELRIGEEIIGNVDRDGFLSCPLERIIEALEEVSREEVEEMRRFRDLSEAQRALLLSATKAHGQYTEGVVLAGTVETLFRCVPPSLILALVQTERHEKARRAELMAEHGCTEVEAAVRIAASKPRFAPSAWRTTNSSGSRASSAACA